MGQTAAIPTLFDHTKTQWFTCLKDIFQYIEKFETVGMHLEQKHIIKIVEELE